MAKFEFDRIVTGEEIKGIIEKDLGSAFRVQLNKKRVEIVQDGLRGCLISFEEKNGRTICKGPFRYIPSVGLRVATQFGPFVLVEIIALSMGYLFVGIFPACVLGTVVFVIVYSLSGELVKRVTGMLEKVAAKA